MTKRLIALLAAALALGVARAENSIVLSTAQGHPGDEVTVNVAMSGDEPVAAIDMKLPLPDELNYVAGSAALTDRCASHQVSASTVDGVLRLVVYTLSLSDITGTEGDVLSFKLKLGDKPLTQSLSPTVVLGNAEGTSLPVSVSAGQVTILCPELTISTTSIDFGHVPIRSTYTKNVVLRNSGNEPLVIHSLTSGSPMLSISASDDVIAAGSSRSFVLTYSPEVREAFSSYVTVDCNAVNNLVYGQNQKVEVVADPYSVNELRIDRAEGISDSEVIVSVRVNNMEPLVGAQFSITLPDALKYVDGSAATADRTSASQVLATQTDSKLTFILYSLDNTPFNGDDGVILTFKLLLEGRSGSYRINPLNVVLSNADSENMTSASYGNYVVISSPAISGDATLSFGVRDVTETMTESYAVKNTGSSTLIIDRVTFLSEGYACTTALPLSLVPGKSSTLTIEHTASEPGDFATTMNIYSNDPALRLKTVALSGTAYSPNTLSITGSYSASSGYSIVVSLENHAQITALQFDVVLSNPDAVGQTVTISPTSRLAGYSTVATKITDGKFRVVAYVFNDQTISGNSGEIMTLTIPKGTETPDELDVSLENMVLSSADSKNMLSPGATAEYAILTSPEMPTGLDYLEKDKNEEGCRYFNLDGIEVTGGKLEPGVYVRVRDGRSEKILVK